MLHSIVADLRTLERQMLEIRQSAKCFQPFIADFRTTERQINKARQATKML